MTKILNQLKISRDSDLIITPLNRINLADVFMRPACEDPYLSSPAYLHMTGRHGAEIVTLGATVSFVCRHPNDPCRDLLFYPLGPDKARLIAAYLDYARENKKPIPQIARVPEEVSVRLTNSLNQRINASFKIIEECQLDWRYSVHTLSTQAVAQAQGHSFKDFRKNISRAQRLALKPRRFDASCDFRTIRDLALLWASRHAQAMNSTPQELAGPYEWLASAIFSRIIEVDGFIINDQAQNPVAFVLWEKPIRAGQDIVASLASLSVAQEKGVSEYLHVLMCQTLLHQGVKQVCIGGSENLGLDAFKRKMNPARSQALVTLDSLPQTEQTIFFLTE